MKPFNADGTFCSIYTGQGLRKVAVRGAGVSILAAGVAFLAQLISTVVLARLLTPTDFGLVTMVTTFSLLLCSFGWNGFTEVILQREEITAALASNLFWICVAGGVILTVGFAALGPVLAHLYHAPLVVGVTVGMSLTVATGSVAVVHSALLNRAHRFATVSVISIVSRLTFIVVSVAMALMGKGYWSLVAGNIAMQVSKSIGTCVACSWIPSLPSRAYGTTAAVKFAVITYSRCCLSYASGNADNMLVGWRFGASALGFYKRAFDLFYLPANQLLSPMSSVVIATLSRFTQDQLAYRRHLLAGISCLAFLGMGLGADLYLVGQDMIRFLMGSGWSETGRIFVFFGPGIGVMLLYNTQGWIHLSIGRPDRWFRWSMLEVAFTISLFIIALPFGPIGIAAAWTISYFALMLPGFWYAGRPIGFELAPILSVIWKFFAASALAGCCALWITQAISLFADIQGGYGACIRVVSDSIVFFALYLFAVIALHRGISPIRDTAHLIADMFPDRSTKQASANRPVVTGT